MTRITQIFQKLAAQKKKALIPFITAGDPDLETTVQLVLTLEKAGADIVELGIPFSDPMADGPVIQAASERALKNHVMLEDVILTVAKIRERSQIPLLLMGYYNPIFLMGHALFAKTAKQAGVDAVLIVDLPPEEAGELRIELQKNQIDLVHLLAPTSNQERIDQAVKSGSGFIYYVSLTGVTGAVLTVNEEIKNQIARIRKMTDLPIAVGFGVSRPEQVAEISSFADGVVVGSALVKLIGEQGKSDTLLPKVAEYVRALKGGN